ncbi:hypothetical protein ES703_96685 [subsurface metagenome]
MAKYSRIEVTLKMKETGIVTVFYNTDIGICMEVAKACYNGGARVFEFTNRGDFAHEVFGELTKYVHMELPEMAMGVGSVLDGSTTSLYIQLGADFIVSPALNHAVRFSSVGSTPPVGIILVQGQGPLTAATNFCPPTCSPGKIFITSAPSSSAFDISLAENLTAWFKAGVHCVGMGSKLISKSIIAEKNYKGLTSKVADAIKIVQELRKKV